MFWGHARNAEAAQAALKVNTASKKRANQQNPQKANACRIPVRDAISLRPPVRLITKSGIVCPTHTERKRARLIV